MGKLYKFLSYNHISYKESPKIYSLLMINGNNNNNKLTYNYIKIIDKSFLIIYISVILYFLYCTF